MRIILCGSLSFAKEMKKMKDILNKIGHETLIPSSIEKFGVEEIEKIKSDKRKYLQVAPTYMKEDFDKIKNSDAILVVNLDKNGIENYIGGNTFAEIMFAFYNNKKVFLLNPISKSERLSIITNEIEAVNPVIIGGVEKIEKILGE